MNNLSEINREYLSKSPTVLYGAGGNGAKLLEIFRQHDVKVDLFCDDDFNKWNKKYHEIDVVSYEKFIDILNTSENTTGVNIIITSVFAGPILKKLSKLNGVRIFEPLSILLEKFYKYSFYNEKLSEDKIKLLMSKFKEIEKFSFDDESQRILNVIKTIIKSQKEADNKYFFDIVSDEDCYFIWQVKESLRNNANIVDCGGFIGDLMVPLKKHHISYNKVFSFEPNKKLFDVMQKNISDNNLQDKFFAFNKGVWNKSGVAFLNFDEMDIAGGNIKDQQKGIAVETITIDEFFNDVRVDFIKMDIEGAELNALRGGIKVIQRDRPILAVSLYHSVNDVVDIPIYLHEMLSEYNFFVRHHSLIGSETVLYAIPKNL